MKAAICTAYGPPEVLKIKEVDRPEPNEDEVLVKIKAASVNSGDVRVRGLRAPGILPIIMRLIFGLRRPRRPIMGMMISGIIEKTGKNIKNFKVGDEVFGSCGSKMGAFAEYVVLKDNAQISLKPNNASHSEAAALVFGGHTAMYFLEKAELDKMNKPKVLIYGATGSVGTFAVELSKYYEAHVTSVCSERGEELARSLGSDEIVFYTKQNINDLKASFDIIFDAVGKIKKKDCNKILKKDGKFVTVGGFDVASVKIAYLDQIREMFEKNKVHANIDKSYSLDDIIEAHRYVDSERKKGNVVLEIY